MSWAPNYKVFWVTAKRRLSRKREVTQKVGFVFVTPWQDPVTRVTEKYPGVTKFELDLKKR